MRVNSAISLAILFMSTNSIFAKTVETAITNANSWITTTFGPVILVLGVAISGVFIIMGNKVGMYKGLWAIAGGLIITLAPKIADEITTWAK